MAITENPSNQPADLNLTGTGNATTAAFSPLASSLVVVLVGGGYAPASTTTDCTLTDSGSHTWTLAAKCHQARAGTSSGGVAAIYYSYFASAPGSITLTAAYTNLAGGRLVAARCLTNAASSQAGAATATQSWGGSTLTNSDTCAITTTTTGSLVYGITNSAESNYTLTLNGSSTAAGTAYNDATDLIALAGFKAAAATGTPGVLTLGGTWSGGTSSNIALFEVLPASGATYTGTGTAALTLTASASPGIVSTATPLGGFFFFA